jgi:hypothetical protein
MLPDFGSFYAQNVGTMPVHLFVSGANPVVMQSGKKLFAVTFVVEYDGQRMMGTIECGGNQADALKVAKELTSSGVYCQPRPDLAYLGIDGWQRVVPFRLYREPEPLSQEASDRIQAAKAKRARKAAKRQITQNNASSGKFSCVAILQTLMLTFRVGELRPLVSALGLSA